MTEQNGTGGETSGTASLSVTAEADAGSPSDAIVVARLAEIEARFGEVLDDAQRSRIRRAVERQMTLARRLRRTPLQNADEPEIVFHPYRRTGGENKGERGG